MIAGVALAACEPRSDGGRGARLATGVGLGLVAALGFGLFFTGIAAAAGGGALVAVALNRATALAALLVAATAVRRRPAAVPARDLAPLAAVGALDALANVLFALALTRGLTGVVSVLGSLYPVTTVLLAHLVLGERTTRAQRLGATACLTGVGAIVALGA
jgi:drug/metabolite transporter (DMT)-like permease